MTTIFRFCFSMFCVAAGLWGCTPEDAGTPRIHAVAPSAAQQDGILTLYGEHFGAYHADRSAVFVNGICAELRVWKEDVVELRVPRGIGIGFKTLVLRTSSGVTAGSQTLLLGQNLGLESQEERVCERGLIALGDAGGSNPPQPDATSSPDTFEDTTSPPSDVSIPPGPDVLPDSGGSGGGMRQVVITDLSRSDVGRNPGVDIDAIVLKKADGSVHYASRVIDVDIGPLSPEQSDPVQALGAPDAWLNFPDLGWCYVREGTVALGGEGSLRLELDVALESGDTLEIYEVGGCNYAPDLQALPELFQVVLTDSSDNDGVFLGEGMGPVAIFTVP